MGSRLFPIGPETGDVLSKLVPIPSQTHVKGAARLRGTHKLFKDEFKDKLFYLFFCQINYHLLPLREGRVDSFNFSKATAEATSPR